MKDKDKEIQSILNEYKMMKRKKEENEENLEDVEEKSVINPELTLEQMRKLKEKDLNIQVMIALIKKQEDIRKDEKKISDKIKKIKDNIGNFRYTYDENGNAINANEMQKMTQKYEKARKELAKIKITKDLCKDNLSDFEKKTGLTINNIKEMIIKEEEQRREYEKQEKLRKERIEKERLERERQEEKERELSENPELNEYTEIGEEALEQISDSDEKKVFYEQNYDKDDIITIFPYQNTASYIFEGREGQIENIRQLIWGDKTKIFGKYKIKEEEYELTNNKTGETREYTSKLNPVVFEVLKTNPKKLEDYMNLNSKTTILYVFDSEQKENKDVAKMMYKYQKNDRSVTQKIGYIGILDKMNSRIAYKLGKKQLALPEGDTEEKNLSEEENQGKIIEEVTRNLEIPEEVLEEVTQELEMQDEVIKETTQELEIPEEVLEETTPELEIQPEEVEEIQKNESEIEEKQNGAKQEELESDNTEKKVPKHAKTRKEIKLEKKEEKKRLKEKQKEEKAKEKEEKNRLKEEQKELKEHKKQEKIEKKKNKNKKQEEIIQEPKVNYEETRMKMEEFRKSVQWKPIETNMATDINKKEEEKIVKEDVSKDESNDAREI